MSQASIGIFAFYVCTNNFAMAFSRLITGVLAAVFVTRSEERSWFGHRVIQGGTVFQGKTKSWKTSNVKGVPKASRGYPAKIDTGDPVLGCGFEIKTRFIKKITQTKSILVTLSIRNIATS